MSLPLTRYEQLIAEELAGIISPEDQQTLNQAKAVHPEVYELWKEKQVLFADQRVLDWLNKEAAPLVVSINLPVVVQPCTVGCSKIGSIDYTRWTNLLLNA